MHGVIPEPYEFSVKGDEAVFILTDSVNIDFCKEARAALSDFSLFLKNVMGIESRITTLLAVCCGGVFYAIAILLLKGIVKDDIEMLPKGEKIAKVLAKFGLLG